jgi:hypothetical protein
LCSDECERSECCEGAQHPGQSRSPTTCAAQAGDFGAQMTLCGTVLVALAGVLIVSIQIYRMIYGL